MAFDRENLRRHVALLGFVRKARADLDRAARTQRGKRDGAARILALQAAQQKPIAAQTRLLDQMDPGRDRSYLSRDHETNLQYLADEYPAAIIGAFSGDSAPLDEVRTEMDRVEARIEGWLGRVRQSGAARTGDP
jgi:hypothetical protein